MVLHAALSVSAEMRSDDRRGAVVSSVLGACSTCPDRPIIVIGNTDANPRLVRIPFARMIIRIPRLAALVRGARTADIPPRENQSCDLYPVPGYLPKFQPSAVQ